MNPANTLNTLSDRLQGKFLVFDGPDGCGKSTQLARLKEIVVQEGLEVVSCRDPGGTAVGERVRSVLLDYDLVGMDVRCETMLFMAARAQLVSEVIRPALQAGKTVLCDRFVTATCAYQGAAGFDPKTSIELARFAVGDCWPDVTIILDVDPQTGFSRIGRRPHHAGKRRQQNRDSRSLFDGANPDAMEGRPMEFHRRVRELFLRVHEVYPTPVFTIDGNGDVETVHGRILEQLLRAAR